MSIEKQIKTKISLRYLAYTTWSAESFKDEKPLKGEVWFCEIPTGNPNATTAPTMLFKVGDGINTFGTLKWASALAADVYDWAKVAGANVFTKDGVGNVVSGIEYDAALNDGKGGFKFTTASVATAEGLEDLQEAVAAIEKDIADNRDAWVKDDNDNTTYQFSIPTTGDDKGKLLIEKREIGETAWTKVDAYDFVTPAELTEILGGYYTKDEADAKFAPIDIDTGVHSVSLVSGSNNGTVKLIVDGDEDEVAVTGLGSAAYVTVDSLNATAKGYADGKDDAIAEAKKAGTDAANALDAYGKLHEGDYDNNTIDSKVAAVLGESTDGATANTVYGAKAAAAAAQNDATIAKTKIETFLGTVTPDGSQDIIDTLTEINNYVGEHGEEFATLSGRVTGIENGTTVVPKATDADTLDGHDSAYFATAESVSNISDGLGDLAGKDKVAEGDIEGTIGVGKISGLGALATKDNITHDLVTDFDTEVAAVKVTNAGNADTLGSHGADYFATATSVTAITEDGGLIDSKISAYDTGKNFGDIITHDVAEFATAAQGEKADTALQSVEADTGLKIVEGTVNKVAIDTDVVFVLDCNW